MCFGARWPARRGVRLRQQDDDHYQESVDDRAPALRPHREHERIAPVSLLPQAFSRAFPSADEVELQLLSPAMKDEARRPCLVEAAIGDRDHRGIFVDIPSDVFLDLHVLVLALGGWIHRHLPADRLPSPGATRVSTLRFSAASARSYNV